MINELDVNELNERVEVELAKQKKIVPAVMLAVSILMVVVFGIVSLVLLGESDPEAAVMMGIMGGAMAVMMQFIGLMVSSGISDNSQRERLVSKAMAQMLRELPTKRKHDRRHQLEDDDMSDGEIVTLGDDGELKRQRR